MTEHVILTFQIRLRFLYPNDVPILRISDYLTDNRGQINTHQQKCNFIQGGLASTAGGSTNVETAEKIVRNIMNKNKKIPLSLQSQQ